MRFSHFEPTPNPNALKCVVEPGPPGAPVRSYFTPAQAHEAGDRLAIALFEAPGITNVLIHTAFVTVCKAPDAKWPPIKKAVKAAIAEHPDA